MEEREQLLQWIPVLFKEKKSRLSIEQLRLLHFVLGYEVKNEPDRFLEVLEQNDYDEDTVTDIAEIIDRDGFIILSAPYYIAG